jgi:DNA invertase Pin-like site-specific DNA recombinase
VCAFDTRRRAAIYTRVSTTSGLSQELTSLDVQREACRVRITHEPTWEALPHSYDDGGYTGANTDRPAFQRLMADIRAGHVNVVVAYKLDRICRSFTDFAKLVELCEEHDVVLVSVTQNFNTGDIMGRLLRNLLAIFAEFERELIVERTRDKIAAARRLGKWTGGLAPLGYDIVQKKLFINESEAVVVRELFALYLEHRSVLRVAQELARRERTTKQRPPSERAQARAQARPPGEQRRVGPYSAEEWSKDMVIRILKNPVYVGLIASGDDLHPGEHKPLIDRETFDRVQRILEQNAGRPAMPGRNPDYLLTGRLRCGACGAAMTPGSTKKGNRIYRFYRCVTRDKMGKEACVGRPLPAAEVERYVVERLRDVGTNERFTVEVTKGLEDRLAAERDALTSESSRLTGPIANMVARL